MVTPGGKSLDDPLVGGGFFESFNGKDLLVPYLKGREQAGMGQVIVEDDQAPPACTAKTVSPGLHQVKLLPEDLNEPLMGGEVRGDLFTVQDHGNNHLLFRSCKEVPGNHRQPVYPAARGLGQGGGEGCGDDVVR